MPHQCTNCGRTFADGSQEMLSGCPDCGGKKFQFRPAGSDGSTDSSTEAPPAEGTAPSTEVTEANPSPAAAADPSSDAEPSPAVEADSPPDSVDSDPGTGTDATDSGATDAGGSDSDSDPDAVEAADAAPEDTAQASARSDVVSAAELDDAAEHPPEEGADPDVETLREELNEQFESIRILNPGQYELNLMELYDRQEYIISLREDGRYVIEMPEGWGPHDG